MTNVHYFKAIKTLKHQSINEITPVSIVLKSKWYLFMNYISMISAHDTSIYHLNKSRNVDSNPAPSAFGSVTSLQHQGKNAELLRKNLLMQDANETRL